ncbi:TRAP transporter substrate-binding protein [Paenibacillaceae bacterium WGS1546]|uniref:TRAP transporter substrate-binding protein n=1 Tax=Cohnella sp. WGS1546 TaxID=3366810 RepID=UPI00372D6B3E
MKQLRSLAVLLLSSALLLSACGQNGSSGKEGSDTKSISLRLAHVGSESHQYQIAAEKFKEIVEERTNGEIKIDIFNNGVLGNENETVEQVIDGTLDITAVVADSSFANVVPEMNVFGIPYLFRDLDHVYKTLDGEIGQELIAKADAKGMKYLGFWEIGFRHVTNSKREIATPQDIENLKIRVQPSPVWDAHMAALKANGTPIPFNELYSAMDQGVVDGQENPLNTIYSMKFYEVQKYLSLTGHTYSPGAVAMSIKSWEGLTAEQQTIIEEAFKEAQLHQRQKLAEIDAQILDEIKEKGVIVTEPDIAAFREVTKNVKDVLGQQVPAELIERIESVN